MDYFVMERLRGNIGDCEVGGEVFVRFVGEKNGFSWKIHPQLSK